MAAAMNGLGASANAAASRDLTAAAAAANRSTSGTPRRNSRDSTTAESSRPAPVNGSAAAVSNPRARASRPNTSL